MIVQHHLVFGKKYKKPIPADYILAYDFNGNSIDKSANNNNGINTNVSFSTGRKSGTQCAVFSGNSLVETSNNIVYGGNKMTLSFWMQAPTQTQSIAIEQGTPYETYKAFIFLVGWATNEIRFTDSDGNYNLKANNQGYTTWNHWLVTLNRDLAGIDEITIYRNNSISYSATQIQGNHTSNFISSKMTIGGRKGLSTNTLTGSIQDLKLYNRVLTSEEILNLYNE